MKVLGRALLALAVLAVVLAVLAPWLAKRYLPPEKARALLCEQARKSLGRDVRVGDVTYGIWGTRLSDVALSQVPDFSAGTFATVGKLVIRPSWLSLLRRRLVIASVSADQASLHYLDPGSGLDVEVAGLSGRLGGFRLSGPSQSWGLAAASIRADEVRLRSAGRGLDVRLTDVSAKVRSFRLSEPFEASVSFAASGYSAGRPFQGSLSAGGAVDLGGSDPRALRVELSKLELRYQGLVVKGSIRESGLSPAQADLDLAVEPDGKSAPLGLPRTLALPTARVRGGLSYFGDELILKDVTVDAGQAVSLALSGSIGGIGGKPTASLQVRCSSFDAARLAAFDAELDGLGLRGSGSFEISVRGSPAKPSVSGTARVQGAGAVVAGLPLSGFSGRLSFDNASLSVPDLRGRFAGSQLRLSVTAKNYLTHPYVDLKASLDRFDLGEFLDAKDAWSKKRASPHATGAPKGAPASPAMVFDTRGQLTVGMLSHPNIEAHNVSLQWNLSGVAADLSHLNGSAKVSSTGGRIHTLAGTSNKSKVSRVLLLPLMIIDSIGRLAGLRLVPNFSNAKYTELAGDCFFQNGVMNINDTHVYADVGKANAKGRVDLPHERLAVRVKTEAEQMAAPLEFDVSGTFENPKYRFKTEKLIEQGARQLIEGPLKQVLGQPAQKLLKGLFGDH